MKRMTLLAFTAMFALLATVAAPALAQESLENKDDLWWDQLETQLIQSLDAPVEQVQTETLQHVIFFATNYADHIDLTDATPALLDMYASNIGDARRAMALAALHAVGNEVSMRQLALQVEQEESERIRELTRIVLADYFGS